MNNNTTRPYTFGNFTGQTPRMANVIFAIFATLTTVAAFIVASDPGIPDAIKVRAIVYIKAADLLALGIAKAFGYSEPPKQETPPEGPAN